MRLTIIQHTKNGSSIWSNTILLPTHVYKYELAITLATCNNAVTMNIFNSFISMT